MQILLPRTSSSRRTRRERISRRIPIFESPWNGSRERLRGKGVRREQWITGGHFPRWFSTSRGEQADDYRLASFRFEGWYRWIWPGQGRRRSMSAQRPPLRISVKTKDAIVSNFSKYIRSRGFYQLSVRRCSLSKLKYLGYVLLRSFLSLFFYG